MAASDWRLEDVSGVRLVRCAAIDRVQGVAHAFATRQLDCVRAGDDTAEIEERRRLFMAAAGFGAARPAIVRQVHGIELIATTAWPERPPTADGVVRIRREDPEGPIPAVGTADCVPMLIVDRSGSVFAAVHAGWRGIAAGIAHVALNRLKDAGVPPEELIIAMGPAIGGCCYEVGPEVARALLDQAHEGSSLVDLRGIVRSQLAALGVPDRSIHAAPWCTRCRADLFFSYRAEGPATGRMLSVIGPAAQS